MPAGQIGEQKLSEIWANAPSPCVDVCKYKRQGRCVGCTMTKAEKDSFPASGNAAMKKAFFETVIARVSQERNPAFWAIAYRRKCERAGVACPLDDLD
ncbi:DUF1289 domain-containing protein [Aureimonas fodinaquatilis]|uniref:DUF1289 domain-containing protein n=1 Tax=Aureimonas fodinaquatilis TaxID=2565783 RepID=A0A5B0DYP0_9HYPH|nr:DUF1289 domain-containing protein [Aureimonas fodinaquatilis]KAA0971623.1 DUF1289 domain-containing protein [Aureimonas fodinaquatilis]